MCETEKVVLMVMLDANLSVELLVVAHTYTLHLIVVKLAVVMCETEKVVLMVMLDANLSLVQRADGVMADLTTLADAVMMSALVLELPLLLFAYRVFGTHTVVVWAGSDSLPLSFGADAVFLALAVAVRSSCHDLKLVILTLVVVGALSVR